ncbi:hypothetical protein BC829DRAFT_422744 [Chytridium lagenaria]|nr:hypothetical protein BC829DRAFT_422744 [Chytridium lagenaria]
MVVDMLFLHTHHFRLVFLRKFHQFAQLSCGIQDHRLPEPKEFATKCREAALSAIRRWNEKYGEYYKQLDVGYNYMLDRVKIDFSGSSNFKGNLDPELHEKKRLEGVRKQIFEATTREVEEELHGIFKNVNEMWSLIEILDITVAASLRTLTLSMDNDLASIARRHGMAITDYNEAKSGQDRVLPVEGEENKIIFDTIRECVKLLVTKHMPLLEKWQRSIFKLDENVPKSARSLRIAMGLKGFLSDAREQAVDLLSRSIASIREEEFGDEDFEEV